MLASEFVREQFSVLLDSRSLLSVDLSAYGLMTVEINRIFVPRKHRFQGLGSSALQHVTARADDEGIVLRLHINPYDDALDYDQLFDWYSRNGFEKRDDYMLRRPNNEV